MSSSSATTTGAKAEDDAAAQELIRRQEEMLAKLQGRLFNLMGNHEVAMKKHIQKALVKKATTTQSLPTTPVNKEKKQQKLPQTLPAKKKKKQINTSALKNKSKTAVLKAKKVISKVEGEQKKEAEHVQEASPKKVQVEVEKNQPKPSQSEPTQVAISQTASEHESANVKALKASHENEIADIYVSHQNELQDVKNTHFHDIKDIKTRHELELTDLQQQHHLLQQRYDNLLQEHEENAKLYQATLNERDEKVTSLLAMISTLEKELNQVKQRKQTQKEKFDKLLMKLKVTIVNRKKLQQEYTEVCEKYTAQVEQNLEHEENFELMQLTYDRLLEEHDRVLLELAKLQQAAAVNAQHIETENSLAETNSDERVEREERPGEPPPPEFDFEEQQPHDNSVDLKTEQGSESVIHTGLDMKHNDLSAQLARLQSQLDQVQQQNQVLLRQSSQTLAEIENANMSPILGQEEINILNNASGAEAPPAYEDAHEPDDAAKGNRRYCGYDTRCIVS